MTVRIQGPTMASSATPLRVGVNARTFSVSEPGGEVQCGRALVEALADREDLELVIFSHTDRSPEIDGTERVTSGLPDRQTVGIAWEAFGLPGAVERSDLDVLFCPTSNAPLRPVSVPVVTWIHDVFAYQGYASGLYHRFQRVRVPRVVANTDHVTTVSEFAKQEIRSEFDLPDDGVTVVYNGIDDHFFGDSAGESIDLPERYLLYVGGLNDRKNVSGLLTAYRILREQHGIDHHLVLAGPGRKLIYDRVDSDLAAEGVDHRGFLAPGELKYAYENADAFVFVSNRETFGAPPVEAMACGTPVVASDRPCLPEVLGDAAEFVDPTDPESIASGVLAVLEDPELRERLISAGTERASGYTWDRAAKETVQVLERAVRSRTSTEVR